MLPRQLNDFGFPENTAAAQQVLPGVTCHSG
jgi:hypothetical protein